MKSRIKNAREERRGGRRRWRVESGWKSQVENAEEEVMARGGWREERDLKSCIENAGENGWGERCGQGKED